MVKLLGKTIRQLSEELKLSKQAINQRINSINGFRSKHTYKVKNHLEIDNQGVKMLANFGKQKRQDRQPNQQDKNDKNDKIDHILLKQLDVKDQQISKLQKALDQQQQLQLATLAENRQLKNHIQKLIGLIETSKTRKERQAKENNDDLSNSLNPSTIKNSVDTQVHDKKENIEETYQKERIHKSKGIKNWWNFWK